MEGGGKWGLGKGGPWDLEIERNSRQEEPRQMAERILDEFVFTPSRRVAYRKKPASSYDKVDSATATVLDSGESMGLAHPNIAQWSAKEELLETVSGALQARWQPERLERSRHYKGILDHFTKKIRIS